MRILHDRLGDPVRKPAQQRLQLEGNIRRIRDRLPRPAYAARLPRGGDLAVIAPILCAGVTTYKDIRKTEARPGEWIAISGVGGLGQVDGRVVIDL